MTAFFIAYIPDETNCPVPDTKVLLCERLTGIGRIRGYIINGNSFALFDRDGNGITENVKGTKIMWSGKKPDHTSGYNGILNWFRNEVLPNLTQSVQAQ